MSLECPSLDFNWSHALYGLACVAFTALAFGIAAWRQNGGQLKKPVATAESMRISYDSGRLRYRYMPSYADIKGGDTPWVSPKPKHLTPEETEQFTDDLARRNPELVARLQETAQRLAREKGKISSDDVWEFCPIPPGVEPRIMARAFMPKKLWRKVGHAQTRRKERQGGTVTVWELREREAA